MTDQDFAKTHGDLLRFSSHLCLHSHPVKMHRISNTTSELGKKKYTGSELNFLTYVGERKGGSDKLLDDLSLPWVVNWWEFTSIHAYSSSARKLLSNCQSPLKVTMLTLEDGTQEPTSENTTYHSTELWKDCLFSLLTQIRCPFSSLSNNSTIRVWNFLLFPSS